MRIFITAIFFFVVGETLYAQSNIAKIKYEQAEEAYNNSDYKTTILKLDEVEKLLGSVNPRIMYLRIMAQKALIDKGNYSYGLLDSLRKSTAFYIKSYETNTAIEDKYREVYLLSEQLVKYPSTKDEYNKLVVDWKIADDKRKAEEEASLASRRRTRQFIDSLVNAYKFLPCATIEEFKKYNPQAAASITKAYPSNYYSRPYIPFGNNIKVGPRSYHVTQYPAGLLIDSFIVITNEINKQNQHKVVLQGWKDLIYANVPANMIEYDPKKDNIIKVRESVDIPVGLTLSLWEYPKGFIELIFTHSCENDPRNKKAP